MICISKLYDKICDNSSFEPTVLAMSKNQVEKFIINEGRIYFNLKEGEQAIELGNYINEPNFSMVYDDLQGQNTYNHSLDIAVNGLSEYTLNKVLKGLEGDYFVAVKTSRQDVLIYGFNNLLSVSDYVYGSGANLQITSKEEEFSKPLFFSQSFEGDIIGSKFAFDNKFKDLDFDVLGDFNDDFSNDFYK